MHNSNFTHRTPDVPAHLAFIFSTTNCTLELVKSGIKFTYDRQYNNKNMTVPLIGVHSSNSKIKTV